MADLDDQIARRMEAWRAMDELGELQHDVDERLQTAGSVEPASVDAEDLQTAVALARNSVSELRKTDEAVTSDEQRLRQLQRQLASANEEARKRLQMMIGAGVAFVVLVLLLVLG